jgi:hypothetical protein
MVAFLTRMPFGIPGDVTRQSQAKIEAQVLNASLPFSAFGLFGKIASGKFVPFAGAETAADAYGILVRPYPITGTNASDPLGTSVPPTTGLADVLRSGYINVKNNAGTPAVGGAVYVRIAAAAGKPIGGFEAAADGVNTIAITGATFAGAADANGNVEIAYNI